MTEHPQDQPIPPRAPDGALVSPPPSGSPESRPFHPPVASPASPDARIQGGSIRLFRVAGIDVFLHWSWFLFALLRLQTVRRDDPFDFVHYDAQGWYLAEYVALFGFVLLHEFGHVLACRSVGGIANRIVLWPLGGVAFVEPPARPLATLWSIAAGPLVNLLLLVPTFAFWMACRAAGFQETAPDVLRFAVAATWTNVYLLLFNILPIFPLDGGKILQALLWFRLGRGRSTVVAGVVGVLTALGVLLVAIGERSLVWGIVAAFGVLFSLVGLQGAFGLKRMLNAPRRKEAACPACGAAPPVGTFWACPRCWLPSDVFAAGGICPTCSTPLATVFCPECGKSRPYTDWHPAGIPPETSAATPLPGAVPIDPGALRSTHSLKPPTVKQRIVCGTIFAIFALCLCGLPNVEKQPLGLIVWTVAGAALGAANAGTLVKAQRNGQALRKLRGSWQLVEEDGQTLPADGVELQQLILNVPAYEERIGSRREVRGTCWHDSQAEPPALSFTPKTGLDPGKPHQGIYRLDDKTLTVCVAYPGHPRPTEFLTRPRIQRVRIYRRGGKNGARTARAPAPSPAT